MSLQLHMEEFPPKTTEWVAEQKLYIGQMRRKLHQSGKRRLKHNFTVNPTHNMATYKLGGALEPKSISLRNEGFELHIRHPNF